MSDVVLFVFEGVKPEKQIFESLKKEFFNETDKNMVCAIYDAEIYQLYKEITADDDLDIVELIRERHPSNRVTLNGINRNDVSQVFMFFDSEFHARRRVEDCIDPLMNLLSVFDNETGHGKLYISYPMAEALKDCNSDKGSCFETCVRAIAENVRYKEKVGEKLDFSDIRKYTRKNWLFLLVINVEKAFCLVKGIYKIPDYLEFQELTQEKILDSQISKFIRVNQTVAVLSGFPFFLVEYFGKKLYLESIEDFTLKGCNYSCLTSPK